MKACIFNLSHAEIIIYRWKQTYFKIHTSKLAVNNILQSKVKADKMLTRPCMWLGMKRNKKYINISPKSLRSNVFVK